VFTLRLRCAADTLVEQLQTNAAFSEAVFAIGQHGCGHVSWKSGTTASFPQKSWCAESEVSNGWAAAQAWGPTLSQNFIAANQTSTTSWSLIWSVPEALSPYQNRGAMMASSPYAAPSVFHKTVNKPNAQSSAPPFCLHKRQSMIHPQRLC